MGRAAGKFDFDKILTFSINRYMWYRVRNGAQNFRISNFGVFR